MRYPVLAFMALSISLMGLASCTAIKPTTDMRAEDATSMTLSPVAFSALPNWQNDDARGAIRALKKSCAVFVKRDGATSLRPTEIAGTIAQWTPACRAVLARADTMDAAQARALIETHFTPYRMDTEYGRTGLMTGYYETMLNGSLTRTTRYNTPLYKKPNDLVMVELGDFRPHLKGERIAGRIVDGKLTPYADRAAIDRGALAGRDLEIVWVDDADQAFFLHIQGSGRVRLEDGRDIRVGYDGQNGHVYHAIGRELIARGELTPETTNLDSIRAWLKTHPTQAPALRHKNPSYIFFKQLEGDGPLGAQGVALTPDRSMAVDPRFIPYGAPVFIDMPHPTQSDTRMQQLMVAQDTGGAIRGPVRGDYFWGVGTRAEKNAGYMKSRGPMWLLLPRNVTPVQTLKMDVKP